MPYAAALASKYPNKRSAPTETKPAAPALTQRFCVISEEQNMRCELQTLDISPVVTFSSGQEGTA